jgi:hypothetical protein
LKLNLCHFYRFIVTLGCGSVISENSTYFQSASPSQAAGQCGATVCKCSSDICQVSLSRLFATRTHDLTLEILSSFDWTSTRLSLPVPILTHLPHCILEMVGPSSLKPVWPLVRRHNVSQIPFQ